MPNNIRIPNRDWSKAMWERIKALVSGLDSRVSSVEGAGYITQETDPTVPAWAKAATKPTYTASEVGAKAVQDAVGDPTASGTAVSFIDSLSQNAQGVISPTKKTVQNATQSAAGLMSATDKKKLDGISTDSGVTGVKGYNESSYRTGNVNLTCDNIGAMERHYAIADNDIQIICTGSNTIASLMLIPGGASGSDNLTLQIQNNGTASLRFGSDVAVARDVFGNLKVYGTHMGPVNTEATGDAIVSVKSTTTGATLTMCSDSNGIQGIMSSGYWNGSSFVSDPKWLIYRDNNGNVQVGT